MKKQALATLTRKTRKKKQKLPPGWTEKKIQKIIAYYENQTEEEQLAEHEAAYHTEGQTMMSVPTQLVPDVHKLIARWSKGRNSRGT